MANFVWKNAAGGDWSDPLNWAGFGTPPPGGANDSAVFVDLANSYTVTVKAGTTVGNSLGGPLIDIDADSVGPLRARQRFPSVAR